MDNIITSPLTPSLTPLPGDKVMGGQIMEVPPVLAQFKTGDSLLLKVMFDSQAFKMNTDLSVKLIISNKEVPLKIKFDVPIKLEPDEPHQILAKITMASANNLRFNLVSINNQKPETFMFEQNVTKVSQPGTVQAQADSASALPGTMRRKSVAPKIPASEVPLVKELNTASEQLKFIPLKAAPLLDKLMVEFKIPETLRREVTAAVQNVEFPVKFKAVLPSAEAPELPAENILSPLRQTIQQLAVTQQNPQQIPVVINKLVAQLQELPLQILPALSEIKGEGNITVLSTPLGDVISETPLKIQPQTPILLQISELRTIAPADATLQSPEKVNETISPLSNLLNKFVDLLQPQKLMPQIEKFNFMQFLRPENGEPPLLAPTAKSSAHNQDGFLPLFNILKPLEKSPAQNLIASQLLDKIPALNNKLLSNLYSFVKAAISHNSEAWLGKELSAELKALGAEGTETISRASQYVASHSREGLSWRTVEIPFLAGAELSKIRLAIKKPQDEEDKEKPLSKRKTGTRFLLETDFSKLGRFQFDGFSLAKDRRFDLVIRTSTSLPQGLCAEIVKLFKNSLRDVNYAGNININLKENFIKIMEDENNQIKDGVYV